MPTPQKLTKGENPQILLVALFDPIVALAVMKISIFPEKISLMMSLMAVETFKNLAPKVPPEVAPEAEVVPSPEVII